MMLLNVLTVHAQVAALLVILVRETHDRADYQSALSRLLLSCCSRFNSLAISQPRVFTAGIQMLTSVACELGAATGSAGTAPQDSTVEKTQRLESANTEPKNELACYKPLADGTVAPTNATPAQAASDFFAALAGHSEVPAAMRVLFSLLSVAACSGACTQDTCNSRSDKLVEALQDRRSALPRAAADAVGFAYSKTCSNGAACACRQATLGSLLSRAVVER